MAPSLVELYAKVHSPIPPSGMRLHQRNCNCRRCPSRCCCGIRSTKSSSSSWSCCKCWNSTRRSPSPPRRSSPSSSPSSVSEAGRGREEGRGEKCNQEEGREGEMEVEWREGWKRTEEEEEGENIFHPGGANQSRRVILAELIILIRPPVHLVSADNCDELSDPI